MKNMMVMLWFLVVFVVTKPCAPSLLLVGTGNVSTVQGLLEQNKSRKAQKRFLYIYKKYGGSLCYNRDANVYVDLESGNEQDKAQ